MIDLMDEIVLNSLNSLYYLINLPVFFVNIDAASRAGKDKDIYF